MRRAISLFSLLLLVGGCSTTSQLKPEEESRPELKGPPPSQAQIESDVKNGMKGMLKDPYSAIYEFRPAYRGKTWGGALGGGWKYGYIVPFTVNAKNSFGGYVGAAPYTAVYQNGVLVGVKPESP